MGVGLLEMRAMDIVNRADKRLRRRDFWPSSYFSGKQAGTEKVENLFASGIVLIR